MKETMVQKYEKQGNEIIEQAKALRITDDESREQASEFAIATRTAVKLIEEEFRPDIQHAHELHKSLLDRCKRLQQPFNQAKRIVDGAIAADWQARELEKKKKERDAEIAAESERKRQEEELKREVDEAIESGDVELVESLLESEVVVAPTEVVKEVDKSVRSSVGTTTVRYDIAVTVQDKVTLLKAIVEDKVPDTLVDVNMGMAKKYAKASGKRYIPGLVVKDVPVVSGRKI
ncbi:MAG: hypothetical protein PHQ43_01135 [Dehalococcoidales bacterium]|nr:hypothetical protein [Dehalococcoidales bacterium]